MNTQFITLLEQVESSYRLTMVNVSQIISVESLGDRGTQLVLVDGRTIKAHHSITELHPLLADKSRIVPSAFKIFEQENAKVVYGTELFPKGTK